MKELFLQFKPQLHSIYIYIITHPKNFTVFCILWFVFCGFMEWISNLKEGKNFLYHIWRVSVWGVFVGSIIMFWYVTLGNRFSYGEMKYRTTLFWSYREVIFHNNRFILWQIVWNIAAFIPMGNAMYYLLGNRRRLYKIICLIAVFSLCIELAQLLLQMGLFEFDDIVHNTLGAVLGYLMAKILAKVGSLFRREACHVLEK